MHFCVRLQPPPLIISSKTAIYLPGKLHTVPNTEHTYTWKCYHYPSINSSEVMKLHFSRGLDITFLTVCSACQHFMSLMDRHSGPKIPIPPSLIEVFFSHSIIYLYITHNMSVGTQPNQGNRLCRVRLEEWYWLLRPSTLGFTQSKAGFTASLEVLVDPVGFQNTAAKALPINFLYVQ